MLLTCMVARAVAAVLIVIFWLLASRRLLMSRAQTASENLAHVAVSVLPSIILSAEDIKVDPAVYNILELRFAHDQGNVQGSWF